MSLLPGRDDLFGQFLLWLGLPTLIVVAVMTALTLMDWLRWAAATSRAGRRAGSSLAGLISRNSPAALPVLLRLAFSQGLLLAVSYAIVQLAQVTLRDDLDSGRAYVTRDVLAEVIGYQQWTPWASNAVVGLLVLLTLGNVGTVTHQQWLNALAVLPMWPVGVACALLGVVALLPGLCVLVLGATESGGYTVDMAYLYGLWVVLLFGWCWAALWVASSQDSLGELL
jgi:hypothetical protein